MALRRSFSKINYLGSAFARSYSSEGKLVGVAVNDKTGVATVTMQKPPVNSLDLELLSELLSTFKQLESNRSRGMILTSSSNSIFSAGLDILEMYKPNPERLQKFWTTLQDTWLQLYGSSFPTVAVINGHSPAGGCLLAMSCEYRVMLNNFTIGLNETQLGIVAPFWFISTMRNTIGKRQTEIALTTGRLFKTDEALQVGLVDEVAANKEEALAKAGDFLHKFAKVPPLARSLTKQSLRGADLQELITNREKDSAHLHNFIGQEKVQKGLEMYLEALKKKQKA